MIIIKLIQRDDQIKVLVNTCGELDVSHDVDYKPIGCIAWRLMTDDGSMILMQGGDEKAFSRIMECK